MKYLLAFLALIGAASAAWADVTLASEVFVERVQQDASGKEVKVLEEPKVVVPGDPLVFVLSYKNAGGEPAANFVVTNPIPSAVAYVASESPGAEYSVDGGKSWGALAALTIAQPDGTSRPALPADVTHVRWTFAQPIPAGAEGKLSFRGVVR